MKKYLFLILILFLMLVKNGNATDICVSVTDNNWDRFKTAFLATYPNTDCERYELITMECLKKRYTDDQWLYERTRRFAYETFRYGEETIARDTAIQQMPKDFDSLITLKNAVTKETFSTGAGISIK